MARPPIPKFDDLEQEYTDLFSRVTIKASWQKRVNYMAQRILDNKVRYRVIEDHTGVPWYWIGCVHAMESGVRFSTHLHNGDSLRRRTRRVPRGRPRGGKPPFTWEESAVDAVMIKGLQNVDDWSLARMLYEFERYNGWGYRWYHSHVLSAYLWSGTPLYRRGKYVSDGTWSERHVSKQVGVVALLHRLAELDESIDLYVNDVDAEGFDEDGNVPKNEEEGVNDPVIVPESFPKAEEPRVTTAVKESKTITGALVGFAGVGVSYAEQGINVVMDAAVQVTEWTPAQTLLATLGGNAKSIGLSLAAAGLAIVIWRRISAAQKGKIG